MNAALQSWWAGLSPRERILVSIAATLLSALVSWFLIYTPLRSAIVQANEAHAAAINRADAVRGRVAALAAGAQSSGGTAATSGPVALAITQAAAEAGLALSRSDPAGDDGAAIAISNGRSAAILTLLVTLERQRIHATDLSLRPNGDGTLSLTATLRRGGA